MILLRPALIGFAAGALSVLVFHRGMVALLHLARLVPNPPFPMRAVPPLGLPQIASMAFWGGVWAVLIAAILAARPAPRRRCWWGCWWARSAACWSASPWSRRCAGSP
jgi:hypothetical protein